MNIIFKKYTNKYLKIKQKTVDLDLFKNQLNSYNIFKKKTHHNGIYSIIGESKANHNTKSAIKKKIKRSYHYIPLNSSPFIDNKF